MLKAIVAVVLAISSSLAEAGSDEYYECTKLDGFVEYSLDKCEEGQEQRLVGREEAPTSYAKKKDRQTAPAEPQFEPQQGGGSRMGSEAKLATYKCVGKLGDILYTDARDYLAFEIYRCARISLGKACEEAHRLKTDDPLAVVSNKLTCPPGG